jgi:hypothetical protein
MAPTAWSNRQLAPPLLLLFLPLLLPLLPVCLPLLPVCLPLLVLVLVLVLLLVRAMYSRGKPPVCMLKSSSYSHARQVRQVTAR